MRDLLLELYQKLRIRNILRAVNILESLWQDPEYASGEGLFNTHKTEELHILTIIVGNDNDMKLIDFIPY